MVTQLPKEETVTIEELVVSHMYEMIALVTLLDKKGIVSKEETLKRSGV
jgi:hypothetical protein